jgi:sRNA-binding regulator protein Hfq
MNWREFNDKIRCNFSSTYNIEIKGLTYNKWNSLIDLLMNQNLLIEFSTVENGIQKNVSTKIIQEYFNSSAEYWPCLVLSINGFRIDGFIKSFDYLELWFNDESETLLSEKIYNDLHDFMKHLNNLLKLDIEFVNEDAVSKRLITKIK